MRNVLFVCLVAAALSGACARQPPSVRIPLETGWTWAVDTQDPSSYTPLSSTDMRSLDKLIPGGIGRIWLKYQFDLPPELAGKDLSCYLGRISLADRTWLNGVFIGGEGSGTRDSFSEWNKSRLYPIPFVLLETESPNTLLVQIRVENEGSMTGSTFIGLREEARFSALLDTFRHSTIHLLIAAILLFMALFHLLPLGRRSPGRIDISCALICLMTAFFLVSYFVTELPAFPQGLWSFLLFSKLVTYSPLFILWYAWPSFARLYLGRKEHILVTVFRLTFLALPLASIFFSPDYGTLRSLRDWTHLFTLVPMGYLLYLVLSSLKRRREDVLPLFAVALLLAALVAFDAVCHGAFKMTGLPHLTGISLEAASLCLPFILARRLYRERSEAEDLNRTLDRRIAEGAAELARVNQKLTDISGDLCDAQTQVSRDIQLAAAVQQHLFRRLPPQVDGWDIAFNRRPRSDLSGDLHDFYTRGTELWGVSLFDVSGHGLDSGLMTLLAQSVIEKTFRDGVDQNIAAVMAALDTRLVEAKGLAENYLTGILLRFRGDRVEYVNAGHPDLLFRGGKAGSVRPVAVEGKEARGRMLGIDGRSDGYTAIGFQVSGGDALFLHGSCLAASRNALGEEFGPLRIRDALASASEATASGKLDRVMAAYDAFIGGAAREDDLTAVMLVRTGGQ